MKEGRRYPRFNIQVPVYISGVDGSLFRKHILLESSDVSGGGLSFETRRKIPLEAKSQVVVAKLGDLADGASIHGRVVHRQQDPKTGRYRVGLEFTEFVNVTREQLLSRIEAWATNPSGL